MREEAGGKAGAHPGPVYSDIPSCASELSEPPLHCLFGKTFQEEIAMSLLIAVVSQ